MSAKEQKFLSSSKHYLSQKFWRFLRNVLPSVTLWNYLYGLRQVFLLKKMEKIIMQLIDLTPEPTEPKSINLDVKRVLSDDKSIHKEADELEKLFNKFDSDKAILHNYNFLYSALFSNIRSSALNVMEIGTYKGASLRSWKEYFGKAKIYGIDIDPDTLFSEERIFTSLADQNSIKSLENINKEWNIDYDVIIDDGWHQPEASVFTMFAFLKKLKKGGIYVLEDIDQEKYMNFYKKLELIFNQSSKFSAEYIDYPKLVPPTNSGYLYGILLITKK